MKSLHQITGYLITVIWSRQNNIINLGILCSVSLSMCRTEPSPYKSRRETVSSQPMKWCTIHSVSYNHILSSHLSGFPARTGYKCH